MTAVERIGILWRILHVILLTLVGVAFVVYAPILRPHSVGLSIAIGSFSAILAGVCYWAYVVRAGILDYPQYDLYMGLFAVIATTWAAYPYVHF